MDEDFESLVESFSWDDESPEITFSKEDKKSSEEGGEEIKKDKVEEEKPINLDFENFDEVEEEEIVENKRKALTSNKKDFEEGELPVGIENVITHLKDSGLIELSEEEEEEFENLSEEEKAELLEDKYEEALEQRFIERIADLPDTVKNLVKYAANGGDVDAYLKQMSKPRAEGISRNLDLEKEANQVKMMEYQMLQEGYDKEYIDSHIETLKDSGKLETMSKKLHEKWVRDDDKRVELEAENQKRILENKRREARAFKAEVTETLKDVESIGNLRFTKEDARMLPSYITDTIKTQDGRVLTPFQKDLFTAMQDKEKLFILAKLVKNGFDFKDIENQAITKKTKELKTDIRRQKTGKNLKSVGQEKSYKRLSDYLND